ncbi:hypothetical protein AB595_10200 [Massilia sp. WF1]|uniref:DUF7673 family protein n=1 Tax=unclassified Massilia TaxID=2609279 RepID=UPI0006492E9D|nr:MULTISPECIES: hypothetical protein [unclassified Massilia]ALK99961.1 hypothetical protein AM586_27335 [Massilia sp. WG5]KLU36797.1 hypothetical protein AB595_10200 [Massilia sp. WF1]
MAELSENEGAALRRLIGHAKRDTGQSRRVADFLLAWWNPGQCGGFDFTTMWGCDEEIVEDMIVVFTYIARHNHYPDTLGFEADFAAIIYEWRPELEE